MTEPAPTTNEVWKPVREFSDCYEVSDHGRVRNTRTGRFLCGTIENNGYVHIWFNQAPRKARWLLHRAVMDAFAGPCPAGLVVNHIDGNPRNNRRDNLEYVTPSANHLHSYQVLGRRPPWLGKRRLDISGERNAKTRLTEHMVHDIRRRYARGQITMKSLAQEYHVDRSTIGSIISRKNWKYVA